MTALGDPKKIKWLLLFSIMSLIALFGGVSKSHACTDSANICSDIWNGCVNAWSACQGNCSSYPPDTQFYADCLNACDAKYGNNAPNGCLAQYNTCMAGCYWEITSTAGAGGSISSSGAGGSNSTNDSVWCPNNSCGLYLPSSNGGTQTYYVNPNWCYYTSSVYVDGNLQAANPSFPFYNDGTSTQKHSITGSFGLYSYVVTPAPGPGGSLTPSSPQSVGCGSSITFTVAPNPGYHTVSVYGCGGAWNGGTSYTTGAITASCTVYASFSNTYTLTVAKAGAGKGTVTSSPTGISCGVNDPGGSTNPNCTASFLQGSTVTLTASPDSNSLFAGWTIDCSGTGTTCSVPLAYNKTASAKFVLLAPPTGLTATAVSGTQVNLSWVPPTTSERAAFVIERRTGATGAYFPIAVVGPSVTSYASKGLLQNTSYFYRVRAYYQGIGNSNYSTYSNEASATTLLPGAATYSQFAGGAYYTVALKSDGTLWAWGYNRWGQLGDGTTIDKINPTQIGADNTWISVAAGTYHTFGLKSDGTLWSWGDGTAAPVQVGTGNTWVSIAAGQSHTIALKSDGTLWAWGTNTYGQLGDGTTVNKSAPVQIGTENTWVAIAAGYGHTVALKSDGSLWAWGFNGFGQLGDGTTVNKSAPVQISTGNTWVSIAVSGASGLSTFALRSDGTLWAWGDNSFGEIGDGTTINKSSPVQVGTGNTWASAAAGADHALAQKSDGTLWGWGYNGAGQLGDGTTINKSSPVQVGTGNTWASVAAGADHTLAQKSDGTLWAWGGDNYGQLGDGTTTNKSTPTQVTGGGRLLTVTKAGAGAGTVTSSPAGISCGSDCREGILLGSSVTLTVTPDAYSVFAGWSGGGCSGTNTSCTIVMNADTTVTATFNKNGDIYGNWTYCNSDASCPPGSIGYTDTCNGDDWNAFTCPAGASLSCIDVVIVDPDAGDWNYRTVTCVP